MTGIGGNAYPESTSSMLLMSDAITGDDPNPEGVGVPMGDSSRPMGGLRDMPIVVLCGRAGTGVVDSVRDSVG